MEKITVIIVEDHKLLREMWAILITGNKGYEIKGQSGNMDEAVEMIKVARPDIVLLDINLSQGSGMDAVPLIRKFSPGTKIIAISMHNQPAYAKKMMQLGAMAYLTKNSSQEEMFEAMKTVMNGGEYLCKEIKNILSEHSISKEMQVPGVNVLSWREIEIMRQLKTGFSSKEIASNLGITIRTAEVHRHNILKKLNIKNTAALINFINTTDLSY